MALIAGCTSKSSRKISLETPEEISAVINGYKVVGVGESIMRGFGGNSGSFCEYLEKDYGLSSKNFSLNGSVWSSVTTSPYSYKSQLSKVKKGIDKGKECYD
jgi:hypothetical protein